VGRPGDFETLILNSQRIRSSLELLASVKRALSAADGRIGDDRRREERIKDGRHVGLDI
jgi:hypothetical protein